MRTALAALALAALVTVPAASALHHTFETCSPFSGGTVGDLGNIAHEAACSTFHIVIVLVTDGVPRMVNTACEVLIGQPCI